MKRRHWRELQQPVPAPAQVPVETPKERCSGESSGRDAEEKLVANAGSSPNRATTDTRNGVNPRGYVRYGERRGSF